MSLRTNSRMPASTSDTAARSLSTSGVSSICSGRMVAFIGNSSVSLSGERGSPPHDEVERGPSALPILAASCPIYGIGRSFSRDGYFQAGKRIKSAQLRPLPAAFEPGAEALVGGTRRRFADRARDGDAVEQLLLGADLAQPFVVRGRQGLAGDQAGAGIGNAEPRRLVGLVAARRMADDAGHRHDALLDQVVVVLQGQRILLAERQRFAQGGAELALLGSGIDAGFDR